MSTVNDTNAQEYANFFESIHKDTTIDEYEKIFDKEVRFKDPFHDVVGVNKLYKIFVDMYKKLDNPSFKVTEIVQQNNITYLQWTFLFSFKGSNKDESFEGVSRVEFNQENKVTSHIDYWDSSSNLYEKIPILSFFMKLIKKKINN